MWGDSRHLPAEVRAFNLVVVGSNPTGLTIVSNGLSATRRKGGFAVPRSSHVSLRNAAERPAGTGGGASARRLQQIRVREHRQSGGWRSFRAPVSRAEVIPRRGPWPSLEALKFATSEWVEWFNNRRLLEPIGSMPPPEAEARYYTEFEVLPMAAWLNETNLRRTRCGSICSNASRMVGRLVGRRRNHTQTSVFTMWRSDTLSASGLSQLFAGARPDLIFPSKVR